MFVEELPDLEETQLGKDLIAIGERRGEERGKIEGIREGKQEGIREGIQEGKQEGIREGRTASILVYLKSKHKRLPNDLRNAISTLSSAKADRLLAHLPHCNSLRDVELWLDENA